MRTTAHDPRRSERGQVAWALALILLVAALSTAAIAAAYSSITRSSEQTNHIATTQRTEAAVADAVARLSAGEHVPAVRSDAIADCQVISGRSVCYQYWALPSPGNAREPLRYEVISHGWVDTDRDGHPPADGKGVRAVLTPLEAITYQTTPEVAPKSANGKIAYTASPPALLNKPLYSFRSTTINGPDVNVASYSSAAAEASTGQGQVTSSGWISYGRDVSVDSSMMFGYEGSGGTRTSRCTGEPCAESDVHVLTHSYAPATAAATAWMDEATCSTRWTGDWVASRHEGRLDAASLCIDGALVIDAPTVVTKPATEVYVAGAIHITDSLNAPGSTQIARPNKLTIYSSGPSVTFDAQVPTAPGMVVSALIWAPRATCSTDPAVEKAPGTHLGQTTYYGSLACDTISLGGSWNHQFDDSALINYRDPVPGAAKAWTVGTPEVINTGTQWDEAEDWVEPSCAFVPPPVDAAAYWRLNEPSGLLAEDFAGFRDARWRSMSEGRTEGLCGSAAAFTSGESQVSSSERISATEGITFEWWGKGVESGTFVSASGASIGMVDADHVRIATDVKSAKFPFTVQNVDSWHLYTVTIDDQGTAHLFVDGARKASASVDAASSGPTSIATGVGGAMSDLVVYARVLRQAEVTDRWLGWTENIDFTPTDPGTPFTAPANVRDSGSTPDLLSLAWDASRGTFPAPEAYYDVQRQTSATQWETIADHLDTTTLQQVDPDKGNFKYRICAHYNGDALCSGSVEILTLVPPEPPQLSASEVTGTTVVWSWTKPAFTDTFIYRYRVNGGDWTTRDLGTDRSRKFSGWAPGSKIEVQIRGVNTAGPGPWSQIASVYLIPGTPTVSTTTVTTSSLGYSWTAVNRVASYEVRYSRNGAAWKIVAIPSGRTWTAKGLNQGDEVRVQVRAVGPEGATSPWSNTATSYTDMEAPNADKFVISYDWPLIYSQMTSSNGKQICGTGLALETRVRVKVNNEWRDWGGWHQTDAAKGYQATTSSSNYATTIQHQHQNRCVNLSTGRTGPAPLANSGDIQPLPPKPTGVIAGAGGANHQYEAYWDATCTNGTVPRFSASVTAAWGNWSNGSVSYTTYRRDATWGKWTVKVTAWCGANTIKGPTVTATKSGGK